MTEKEYRDLVKKKNTQDDKNLYDVVYLEHGRIEMISYWRGVSRSRAIKLAQREKNTLKKTNVGIIIASSGRTGESLEVIDGLFYQVKKQSNV